MEAAEGDEVNVGIDSFSHLEELLAEGIFAGTADGPWFGLAQIDNGEREIGSPFRNGVPKFAGVIGPSHDVNVRTFGFFQELACGKRAYFGESYPELFVHGWRLFEGMIHESCQLPVAGKVAGNW